MATLPSTCGRRSRTTADEPHPSKPKAALSSSLLLPSWCSGFRKESLDSDRAYDERVTTSTKTSEIRLRQESIRYWNRFLEEAEAAAFGKVVGPTCHQIKDVLLGDFGGHGEDCGENQKQQEGRGIGNKGETEDQKMNDGSINDENQSMERDDGADDDWEYCQQLFGLPSAFTTIPTATLIMSTQDDKTEASSASSTKSNPTPASSNNNSLRMRYPLEVLPIFVITSPLISNCLQDRSKICYSMWRQLNGLESTIDTKRSLPSRACGDNCDKHNLSNNFHGDDRTICLYIPRLLSSWTETLQFIWDGLLSHFENTHDSPSMDPDDPHYYSNPNALDSKRHSYHVSKRKHYEALLDRKVTTESQKSKIGTKKQQSLQDFILEFLQHVYEEPEDFSKQEEHDRKRVNSTKTKDGNGDSKRNRSRCGNLILLLEDPRILHPKVATSVGQSTASSKPNNSNLVQSQLLESLAAWRGMYGIPVSLVVFHSVGSKHETQQNNVLLNPAFESSANGGRFGIQTVRCSIPSSSLIGASIPPSMAFGLWSHYFLQATMGNPIPLLAPQRFHGQHTHSNTTVTEVVLQMCQDALQNESSCSKWVSSIRARLASNFYALKGSFVWDALNPNTAAMMRAPPFLSETVTVSERHISADTRSISNSGGDKDVKPFAIGNDDVQIFQPEVVAWFCSYHKAHTLLSSKAGDHKAGMTLSDKCEALMKCYRLLRCPTEQKELKYLQEIPSKRQKLSEGDCRARGINSGGNLQFWWTISCSLLPLYFLSLTVANEGMMLSSIAAAPGRSTENGSRKRRNDRPLEGEPRWVLERLADVYKHLLSRLEESDNCVKTLDSEDSIDSGIGGVTMIKSVESGTSGTSAGDVKGFNRKESIDESSDNNRESYYERERDQDFVEATLRRYLQRGIKPGVSDTNGNCNNRVASCGATAMEKGHQRSIWQLLTMVREFIVLVAAFSSDQEKPPSTAGNKKNGVVGDDEIRLGMTESILEMNLLALGQVEAWTRRWVEINPLMASAEEVIREDSEGNIMGFVHEDSSMESRPVNFRRRILDNLPPGSRQLYKALEGRLSVDRDDWFHSFDGTVEDFAIGVWTLRKCGLIRPKKTITVTAANKLERGRVKKRREVVSYEKVAVVWC